jgi:3-methylfumaryl-CoA hydratase
MIAIIERTEMLVPEPARALAALLGADAPDLDRGDSLPLLWHWVYLLDRPAQADLAPDGSAPLETAAAGLDGRRMWAGGRVCASGPLRCGEPATKRTRLRSVEHKQGRSGPLTFIVMERQIRQRGRVVIDEQQDIVYRARPPAGPRPAGAGGAGRIIPPADGERPIEISPTLLFRFSALTYNAHRIHYDRDYARDVEGYPGLVVHGPLQALAMAEAARAARHRGGGHLDARCFAYRLLAPLFDHEGMVVSATREQELTVTAVRDGHGRQTAAGKLRARVTAR